MKLLYFRFFLGLFRPIVIYERLYMYLHVSYNYDNVDIVNTVFMWQ